MTDPRSIVTLTMNPSVDVSTSADRVVPNRKLRCGVPRYEPGGGGVNVSRVMSRLGNASTALMPLGGPMGERMRDLLDAEGVDHRSVAISDETRESFMVVETGTGDQFRFAFPGPELSTDEWRSCLEAVEGTDPFPDYLVASGSLPRGVPDDFYARLARITADRGGRMVVDTHGAPLRHVAEVGAYLLKPNVREAREIAGGSGDAENVDVEAVARDLVGPTDVVVLSLASGGAYLVSEGHPGEHIRAPTVEIQSRVGAGDSMVGGIVWALARGHSLLDAARYGVAAGSAAVMTPSSELCRAEDVERLYRELAEETDG